MSKIILYYITHSTEKLRAKYAVKSLKMIRKYNSNIDIRIILSLPTPNQIMYNKYLIELQNQYDNIKCYEIENTKYIDFGKYLWATNHYFEFKKQYHQSTTEKVYFINDSVIITNDISKFFKNNNCDLYGFLDSYEFIYHYQSYAFGINVSSLYIFSQFIQNFINKYEHDNKDCLYSEVRIELEINMRQYFVNQGLSTDCYIKVPHGTGFIYGSKSIYKKLIKDNGLCLIKYNVLSQHWTFDPPDFIKKQLHNFTHLHLHLQLP